MHLLTDTECDWRKLGGEMFIITHLQRIPEVQEVLWDFGVRCDERSGVKLLILVALFCRELLI